MKLEKEIRQKTFRNDSHKLGVNIIYTFNCMQSLHSDMLKEHKITYQQFNVLRILRGQQPHPASVKLIRERMLDKMSDASRIVEKLRVKGFVVRNISEDDRRSCEVQITDKGLQLLAKIDEHNDTYDIFFSQLSVFEIKELNRLLDKLRGDN